MKSLKTWTGLIQEKVTEEGLCFPAGPVVVSPQKEEGQIEAVRVSGGSSLFLFSFRLGELQANTKHSLGLVNIPSASYGQGEINASLIVKQAPV